jgi:hypothetical protein
MCTQPDIDRRTIAVCNRKWRRLTFYRDVMEPTYESPVVKVDKSLTRDVARCIACE